MGIAYSRGRDTGLPAIDRQACSNCGTCATACASGALSRSEGEREVRIDPDANLGCIACGQCMMVCPTGAVTVTGRGVSPGDLVDLPPVEARATGDQLAALLRSRRSVRRFRDEDVPRELIERVVEAASMAPMGIPPWEVGVLVFHGRDKVRALADAGAGMYEGFLKVLDNRPARALMALHPKRRMRDFFGTFLLPLGRTIVEARHRGVDDVLHGAPAALLFHASPYADAGDAAIAATTAMLQADALGLGTCLIGSLPGPLARDRALMTRLGIPDGHVPGLALILGWPAVRYRKAIRRSLQSVTWA